MLQNAHVANACVKTAVYQQKLRKLKIKFVKDSFCVIVNADVVVYALQEGGGAPVTTSGYVSHALSIPSQAFKTSPVTTNGPFYSEHHSQACVVSVQFEALANDPLDTFNRRNTQSRKLAV